MYSGRDMYAGCERLAGSQEEVRETLEKSQKEARENPERSQKEAGEKSWPVLRGFKVWPRSGCPLNRSAVTFCDCVGMVWNPKFGPGVLAKRHEHLRRTSRRIAGTLEMENGKGNAHWQSTRATYTRNSHKELTQANHTRDSHKRLTFTMQSDNTQKQWKQTNRRGTRMSLYRPLDELENFSELLSMLKSHCPTTMPTEYKQIRAARMNVCAVI